MRQISQRIFGRDFFILSAQLTSARLKESLGYSASNCKRFAFQPPIFAQTARTRWSVSIIWNIILAELNSIKIFMKYLINTLLNVGFQI